MRKEAEPRGETFSSLFKMQRGAAIVLSKPTFIRPDSFNISGHLLCMGIVILSMLTPIANSMCLPEQRMPSGELASAQGDRSIYSVATGF